jgi:hypothetical protein
VRTTLHLDDHLVSQAKQLSGIRETTSLVRAGLEALIASCSAKKTGRAGRRREISASDSKKTARARAMILADTSV